MTSGPRQGRRATAPGPVTLFLLGLLALAGFAPIALLAGTDLLDASDLVAAFARPPGIEQAVLETLRLPRLCAAILVGAALGVAGALMQTVLRNPLAAPDIVAVTSGAQLALVAGTLLFPLAVPSLALTVPGGVCGCLLCLLAAGGPRASPMRIALAGVAVSLALGALSSAIILFADDRASGLVLWTAGLLDQTGWTKLLLTAPAIAAGLLIALALIPQLDLMMLGEETARSLGLTRAAAFASLAAAILLSGAAVSLAGPIGFAGLAAPHVARALAGARHIHVIPLSALGGALFLVLADILALNLGPRVATGAVVACLGAPAMIVVVLRMRANNQAAPERTGISSWRWSARRLLPALVGILLLVALAGLAFGDGVAGSWAEFGLLAGLRLPRVLAAAGAGALLALAGTLLQAATRNPLAGPETLGLTQGAALFSLFALLAGVVPGSLLFLLVTLLGSLLVVALLLTLKVERDAQRLVLGGLAMAAGFGALGTVLVLKADLQMAQALSWLAGSTHGRTMPAAVALLIWLLAAAFAGAALHARLDLLLFGEDSAHSLGLPVSRARLAAVAAAALATAIAVAAAGAIGFVGLLAPHAARLMGAPRHGLLLPAAAITGAVLGILADLAGRSLFAPYELPAGIVSALIGAPVLALLLRRGF
ncbi:iron ABC transporter permease [Aureimonas mangrovi]|uniref:iron ABC transporter permease n=1 Tax=Aureimonas mangrovi TaxID=2758041 RepID=UPI00163DDE6D|nr:iron ABC transporter permease [Aureimonas mangrovi]